MIKIVLLIILFTSISSLHTHNHDNHLQESTNNSQSNNLTNIAYFNNSFLTIQTKVDYVKRTLELNDTNSEEFKYLIARCQEIIVGLRVLQASLLKFNLLISQTNKFCPKISSFNRTQITRYMVYTQQKQYLISSYYPTCIKCSFIIPDLNLILQSINKYFKLINNTLDGDFCKYTLNQKPQGLVNLNNSYFKNNLNVDNWYYGSTTKSDYKIYIFKRLSTYNMTDCPQDRPFVKQSQQICFNCPEGSIFNLGKQQCIKCQINQYFDIVTHGCKQCLGKKITFNHTITCQPCILAYSQFYNSTSGTCYICDTKTSYVDLKNQTCKKINCQNPTPKFNKNTQLCQSCGEGQIIDPSDVTKCIKTNYIAICPVNRPIYNQISHQCVPCPDKTVYNQSSQTCQSNVTSVSRP